MDAGPAQRGKSVFDSVTAKLPKQAVAERDKLIKADLNCITPGFLADSRLPVHFAPAE